LAVKRIMLPLGALAPDFDLIGVDGKMYPLQSFSKSAILVIIFTCNHCPYSKDYEDRMIEIQRDYASRAVQLVAINSNDDKAYPEDSHQEMVKRAKQKGFNFPYLRDEDQSVVDSYGAVCTPHVFLFDADRVLRYRGRIDDSRRVSEVKSHDLRNALDDLLRGVPVRVADTKPFGCSIKWYSRES
jgi:peroxiredoxin